MSSRPALQSGLAEPGQVVGQLELRRMNRTQTRFIDELPPELTERHGVSVTVVMA